MADGRARPALAIRDSRGRAVASVVAPSGDGGQAALSVAESVATVTKSRRRSGARAGSSTVAFAHASEAEMARILDFYRVRWEYEPRTFPIRWTPDGRVVESFTPDFYLPEFDLYIELTTLKQRLVRKKNRKLRHLRELYPDLRVKLLYARDFRALLFKYGRAALAEALSGASGQGPALGQEPTSGEGEPASGRDSAPDHGGFVPGGEGAPVAEEAIPGRHRSAPAGESSPEGEPVEGERSSRRRRRRPLAPAGQGGSLVASSTPRP